MKVDYLIMNGFFSNCKKQVPGIQNKANNIKVNSENKSIFCHIKKEQNTRLLFFQR